MLQIKAISKSFQQRGLVLNNLSLEVKEGESIAISGPSGSGKTTLMNIIGLLDRPDTGNIYFKGESLLNLSPDIEAVYRNKNIGFVFQDHLLLPHLTVLENIFLPTLGSGHNKKELDEKNSYISKLMGRMGISDLVNKFPYQISGGEAQRVTLIRALVNKPALLLADEPTGSLDTHNAETLGNLLAEMNRDYGISLIVATHSAGLAKKMAIRFKLEDGILIPVINEESAI